MCLLRNDISSSMLQMDLKHSVLFPHPIIILVPSADINIEIGCKKNAEQTLILYLLIWFRKELTNWCPQLPKKTAQAIKVSNNVHE